LNYFSASQILGQRLITVNEGSDYEDPDCVAPLLVPNRVKITFGLGSFCQIGFGSFC
jgi:hypothetical protein